ncbi:ABC transporter ATP-binding protein [Leucobacter luti]|uniref:NitT/TauT family transport system ATP-binding protein n=1 Tax=Leucobacter luti TaxID=340320 RepID=A0A4V6MD35_9MICO|nr:ABC transporter ATP-binding protein [Leucobacter luti]MBL3699191.1 ABC transporter ATP-binding protein [Leucobacter luti]RZT66689.1 NitT/TauT family transport system ATP-binding protein [Leucobacter luti]
MSMIPPAGSATLEVRALSKTYTGRGEPVEAIRQLDFKISAGELVCIVGPSGAGKTTLLRCLAGLLTPSSGEIVLAGTTISGPPPGLAVVLQEYGRSLFPWLTVAENIELPLKEKRIPRSRRLELVAEALAAVSLAGEGEKYPWQLSGGMQQRVAIARAVAYEPQVLLMDEPFAAVDAQTRFELEDLVRSLWERLGVTVVFVTHDIDEAIYLGERVLVLSGRPTVIFEDVHVNLGAQRSQIETRSDAEFARLRTHVYELVQAAKHGARTVAEAHISH